MISVVFCSVVTSVSWTSMRRRVDTYVCTWHQSQHWGTFSLNKFSETKRRRLEGVVVLPLSVLFYEWIYFFVCIFVCVPTSICVCVPISICVCVPTSICVCVPTCMCVCVPTFICVCVPTFICVCVPICIYMSSYKSYVLTIHLLLFVFRLFRILVSLDTPLRVPSFVSG